MKYRRSSTPCIEVAVSEPIAARRYPVFLAQSNNHMPELRREIVVNKQDIHSFARTTARFTDANLIIFNAVSDCNISGAPKKEMHEDPRALVHVKNDLAVVRRASLARRQ